MVWQIRRTFVVENETKTLGIMKPSIENIRTIVSVLTAEERQLLKDTFLYGGWGDTDYEFAKVVKAIKQFNDKK